MHRSDPKLGIGLACLCSPHKPAKSCLSVCNDTLSAQVHVAQLILRVGISLLGGLVEQQPVLNDHQRGRRSERYVTRESMPIRSWAIVSRSRTVTAWSSRVSKSTVTQNGVPISSWRR